MQLNSILQTKNTNCNVLSRTLHKKNSKAFKNFFDSKENFIYFCETNMT